MNTSKNLKIKNTIINISNTTIGVIQKSNNEKTYIRVFESGSTAWSKLFSSIPKIYNANTNEYDIPVTILQIISFPSSSDKVMVEYIKNEDIC